MAEELTDPKTQIHPDAYRHGPHGMIVIVRNNEEDVVVGGLDALEACAAGQATMPALLLHMPAAYAIEHYEDVLEWAGADMSRPIDGSTQHGR